jgi:hypothetical protein
VALSLPGMSAYTVMKGGVNFARSGPPTQGARITCHNFGIRLWRQRKRAGLRTRYPDPLQGSADLDMLVQVLVMVLNCLSTSQSGRLTAAASARDKPPHRGILIS